MAKNIGIVVCNFNKREYLQGCLKTLFASNFDDNTFDVIVVDNASSDDSVHFIKENYQSVILLENEINTGGSGGFDRGIRYCIEKKYEYVCLLDNDILLEKDTILNLLNYIKVNPNVGVVGSKICTMDNPDILQELGSFIDWEENFNLKTLYKGYKDDETLPEIVKCDYVPACCLITTKRVLQKVGSFNTDHFIYWDDMDWCTRVKRHGWEIHAINDSRVFHKMGVANHSTTFGTYYFHRNRLMFFLKYLDESKIQKFIDATSKWLLSLSFFSYLKKDYATPTSVEFAIDDLLLQNLSKQEDSILERNKDINIFTRFNFRCDECTCIYLSNENDKNHSTINMLSNYFHKLEIITELNNLSRYKYFFIFTNHILDFNPKEYLELNDKTIIIDKYMNSEYLNNHYSLMESYINFKETFENSSKIILEKRLKRIRKFVRGFDEI